MSKDHPLLLIVTGPPGAGKSTVARRVAASLDPSVLVEGDRFFSFVHRGAIVPWTRRAQRQNEVVTEAAGAAAGRYAAGGYGTVYDGIVGPWFLERFLRASGLDAVGYVVLLPAVERCVERVAGRVGHGFSDEDATRDMHRQFVDAAIDRRHVVDDPVDAIDVIVGMIVEGLTIGAFTYRRTC